MEENNSPVVEDISVDFSHIKKRNKVKIIIIVVSLAVLAAGAFILYGVLTNTPSYVAKQFLTALNYGDANGIVQYMEPSSDIVQLIQDAGGPSNIDAASYKRLFPDVVSGKTIALQFIPKEEKIKDDTAIVKVQLCMSGSPIIKKPLNVQCIKIDGRWYVTDWG